MRPEKPLERLVDAGRAPLHEWPEHYRGYQGMGYLCSYVPEEIIHAAGYVPVRLRGSTAPLRHADAYLQSFTCALCRSSLDQALNGALDFLVGTVFAHTCDTMQALADLWPVRIERAHFLDTVMQPANLGSPAARGYLLAELERFRDHISAFSGSPVTGAGLRASIVVFDETRRLVQALHSLRHRLRTPDFYAVLDAAQIMPREDLNPLLEEVLQTLGGEPAAQRASGPRLFLVGAVLDEPRLLDLLEDLGAQVAGDDLCSGSRHFAGRVGTERDPLPALVDFYLRRTPCPTKLHPGHRAGEHLLDQAQLAQADAIVFLLPKFCEPHAFEYATAIGDLEKMGMPHLLLEMEQTPSLEALRTRLQAFIEIL